MSGIPPDDDVPLGPDPEPVGRGGAGGSGGAAHTEPLATAALVWALVSIVLPVIGTIIAFVLAQRAADSIRNSDGTRTGLGLVTAARVTAGVVLALWAIGVILFFALRGGSSSNNSNVVTPTNPVVTTTLPPATTVTAAPTTTTHPAPSTTVAPTTSIVPPPATTQPVVTTTTPPATTSTSPPTTTTSPDQHKSELLQQKMLASKQLGPSNRGVPDAERFVVTYVSGQNLLVTWAINNGAAPLPTGEPTCPGPPTTTTAPGSTTTTSSTTTTTKPPGTTTTEPASERSTSDEARYEARQILLVIKNETKPLKLRFNDVQLVGTYPITGATDVDVVQVLYAHATVLAPFADYQQAFDVPPAELVQCLNPAFATP
jgi:hypothetical protein